MRDDQLDNIGKRIGAASRAVHGTKVTAEQMADAASLLDDLIKAGAKHGITFADWDGIVDLPGAAVSAILAKHRAEHWYGQPGDTK